MDRFLQIHDGPIIITEMNDEDRLLETIGRVHQKGIVPQRYFLPTHESDPEPRNVSWKQFYQFLSLFSAPEIFLAGGFLDKDPSPLERGCLGYTRYLLRRNGFRTRELEDLAYGLTDTNYYQALLELVCREG